MIGRRKADSGTAANCLAIVAGIGSYNDLGLIRSCGEAGIKSIYVVDRENLPVPIFKSKYVIEHICTKFECENIKRLILSLKEKYQKKIVVFPACDTIVEICDAIYQDLPPEVEVSHAKGRIPVLMDKAIMGKMAEKAGLKVPYTTIVTLPLSSDTLDVVIFPAILKPVSSTEGGKADMSVVKNKDEMMQQLRTLVDKNYHRILVQQYVHTSATKEVGVTGIAYSDGTIEIRGQIEKIRNRGNVNNFGVYDPSYDIPDLNNLIAYIRDTGYCGIFDTDFIFDDETYYFLECNFRNGAYGYCTTKSGFNMPAAIIEGRTVNARSRLKKTVFMEERTDLLNVLHHSISLYSWVKDIARTDTFLWFNRRDLGPVLRVPCCVKNLLLHIRLRHNIARL